MTIATVIRINDGLVLATDSASAITEKENETSKIHQTYFNADKLFNLKEGSSVGCLTWGDGSINGISIAELTKIFEMTISQTDMSVKDICELFIEFIEKTIADSLNVNIGFVIAGYSKINDDVPEMYCIEVENGIVENYFELSNDNFSISWFGSYDFLSRFIFGIDIHAGDLLKENGFDEKEVDEMIEFTKKELAIPLGFSEMPIQDAIDLADFLVDFCKKTSRFIPGPQIIGGPTDIAIITPYEGFSWIKRKHYNAPGQI